MSGKTGKNLGRSHHAASHERAGRAASRARASAQDSNSVLRLQRATGNLGTAKLIHSVIDSDKGHALDPGIQGLMESTLGEDFSRVRVHTGVQAERSASTLNASAYAVGEHVVLGRGLSAEAGTRRGKLILAHELAHVAQQRSASGTSARVSRPGDRFEKHADSVASLVEGGLIGDHDRTTRAISSAGGAPPLIQRATTPRIGEQQSEPEFVHFDQDTRSELIKFWQGKINAATTARDKARFQDFKNRLEKNLRPTPRQSEMEIEFLHGAVGAKAEQSYVSGRAATRGRKGSTRPDVEISGALVEVKNSKITNAGNLAKELNRQITARREHGPVNIKSQTVILDLRGQKVSKSEVTALVRRLSSETGLPARNFQVVMPQGSPEKAHFPVPPTFDAPPSPPKTKAGTTEEQFAGGPEEQEKASKKGLASAESDQGPPQADAPTKKSTSAATAESEGLVHKPSGAPSQVEHSELTPSKSSSVKAPVPGADAKSPGFTPKAKVPTEPKMHSESGRRSKSGAIESLHGVYDELMFIQSLLTLRDWKDIQRRLSEKPTVWGKVSSYAEFTEHVADVLNGVVSHVQWALSKLPKALQGGRLLTVLKFTEKVETTGSYVFALAQIVHAVTVLLDPSAGPRAKHDALGNLTSGVISSGELIAASSAATEAAAGALSLLVAWFFQGFSLIHEAHEAGDKQAFDVNYTQTWAETMAAALVSQRIAPRPLSVGDENLNKARSKGRADAFAQLNKLYADQAKAIGEQLTAAYGKEGTVKRTLITAMLQHKGYRGLNFSEGATATASGIVPPSPE